jgi:general secretion pathway protein E
VNAPRPVSPAITAAAIAQARAAALASGRPFIEILEKQSGLDGEQFVRQLAGTMQLRAADPAEVRDWTPAFDLLSFPDMLQHGCLLMRDAEQRVLLLVGDPFDIDLLNWAEARIRHTYAIALLGNGEIAAWQARHEQGLRTMESVLPSTALAERSNAAIEELSFRGISTDASPIIKLVNSTVYDALRADASDIHLETTPAGMLIKYRVDGVLGVVGQIPSLELAEQTISRIKVMSELDIAERRVPQDGRFRVSIEGREVDLRVSIMPSIHGEDAVLRILDKQSLSDDVKGLRLDSLGFDAETSAVVRRLASEPYGMLLVTGPTGSGKTTTLYAAISEINRGDDKIITIEDPVEYQLPGVVQVPVNEKKGLTFARGLRSILRHDPDKIMVGEIRDVETAQIAIQSALTGHLVFTTVHANNVFDVIGRFTHMGIDLYSFVAALNGVLAQRLIRVNCQHCLTEDHPDDQMLRDSGIDPGERSRFVFRRGTGCGHCRGTGFKGRKAIAEVLHLTDEMRELIVARAPIRQIKEAARSSGTQFLRESALVLVSRGETTLAEINRVTFVA